MGTSMFIGVSVALAGAIYFAIYRKSQRAEKKPEIVRDTGKVMFQGPGEANGTVYFDQLPKLPPEAWDRCVELLQQHFPGTHVAWWPRGAKPKQMEAFLRDWTNIPDLQLIEVREYERQYDGYFSWRFDYTTKTAEVN
ncbi:MAG: hypothetical protein EPN45_19370 [Rhizobiaceae bacterium]|nr:MAG: hypothetical protein EPN45_19370 [Rhizobiaceae bacterium]